MKSKTACTYSCWSINFTLGTCKCSFRRTLFDVLLRKGTSEFVTKSCKMVNESYGFEPVLVSALQGEPRTGLQVRFSPQGTFGPNFRSSSHQFRFEPNLPITSLLFHETYNNLIMHSIGPQVGLCLVRSYAL